MPYMPQTQHYYHALETQRLVADKQKLENQLRDERRRRKFAELQQLQMHIQQQTHIQQLVSKAQEF
jgi:predicted nucleic acid-binding OB-fold protein